MSEAPPGDVIRAFGGDPSVVVSLDGGEGISWRAGNIVLKPAGPQAEIGWIAAFVESLDLGKDVRVSKHVRTSVGAHVCGGWAATNWLDGRHRAGMWDETLSAARAFHDAARKARVEWPTFMSDRTDPWSRATRMAWAEEPLPSLPPAASEFVDAMVDLADGSSESPRFQVIHSDLAGNVLFANDPELPPAVIDISPQFRTVQYAEALLVADAVAWNGASIDFARQFLDASRTGLADIARAIIFRIATAAVFHNSTPARVVREAAGYQRLMPVLLQ